MGLGCLITGGCGFIGTSLVRKLLQYNRYHPIRIVDNMSVGTFSELEKICEYEIVTINDFQNKIASTSKVQLIVADILDTELMIKAAENIDVVIHLAANTGVVPSIKDPMADCMINIKGTLNVLEACRINNVSKFVFASSGASIGAVTPPIHEELVPHPVSPYGASKLAGEAYCSAYFRSFGIKAIALRFSNVYGPGSKHKTSVVAKFIKHALSGLPLEIYGDGKQTRDFIYIDDLVDAIEKTVQSDNIGGEIFQIATQRETTINELADTILSLLRENGIPSVQIMCADERKGDVLRNYSDTQKAAKFIGWQAKINIKEGLSKTLEWYMASEK